MSEPEKVTVTTQGSIPEYATHATTEMAALISEMSQCSEKQIRAMRRKIRYRLFRIRDGVMCSNNEHKVARMHDADKGLRKWMELQFPQGQNWSDFTFAWDVSYKEPLKLIGPFEWDGEVIGGRCDPAAFTHQEV